MKIKKLLFSVFFSLASFTMCLDAFGSTVIFGNETAYLHTDRNLYIAGENIFFRVYLIDTETHKLSKISKIAYLVLRNDASIPIARIKLKVENGTAYGSIYLPDSLKSGIYQFAVFTNWMRNVGEGSFFTKEIVVANRFDKDIKAIAFPGDSLKKGNDANTSVAHNSAVLVSTGKTEYHKREKISFEIKLPQGLIGDSANLSVSVSEDIPGISNDVSVGDYLKSGSEYSNIQSVAVDQLRFFPEQKGEIIQGKVVDEDSKKANVGSYVFLTAADTLVNLQYDRTDTAGKFRFQLNDYYYGKDLYFNIKDIPEGRRLKIEPEDKFQLNRNFKPSQNMENPVLTEYIQKSQDIVTIQKTYDVKPVNEIKTRFNPDLYCPLLYYKASYRIVPADYIALDNFTEIAKEILPPQFSLKKRNDTYTAAMADENLHLFMDQEPVLFLDGVYLHDINQIIELGSERIKRIELIASRFNCGELIFPGIVAVFSQKNEIKNISQNTSCIHLQLDDYYPFSGFNSPVYIDKSLANLPDFRQLLYWNPSLEILPGKSLVTEFYASDQSGNYTIRIEGITSAGVPVSMRMKIKVK